MKLQKSRTAKVVAGLAGFTMAFSFAFGGAVAPAQAATAEELQAQIASLLATIQALQAQLSQVSGGTSGSVSHTFTVNLRQGSTGNDVRMLQKLLNQSADTRVAASGAGSPGNETSTFGPATKAAVIKFQNKYASEVLTPVGLSSGTGFVGAATRAKLNALAGAPVSTTPTTPTTPIQTTPTGTGLTVAPAAQPAQQLAPLSAARIPFTRVTFTAGGDGDVRVDSLVVQRTGPSKDSAFDGIVLLDEQGIQIGDSKTLNSSHQATLTEAFTVVRGTSRTLTIAGNRTSTADAANAGNLAALSLVAVNTSATVTGSLPITGTSQTLNEALVIGVVTTARGSLDPGTSVSKEVGLTNYTFSAVRITAGSAEDIILKSLRWNQTESVGKGDLANIKTYIDNTAYDTIVSPDGKFYLTVFGNGITIPKGFSKEISIKGDIVGGSGRKVDFDIADRIDIHLTGALYGYGITPPLASSAATADGAAFNNADDYYYDAAVVTVTTGTMNVSASNQVPAQNIAVNTANQPLGGFIVDIKGESITVGRIGFNITLGSEGTSGDVDDITSITIVDENGSVIAGPVDGTAADSSNTSGSGDGSVVFTDTVTFPVGLKNYFLKGKVGTDLSAATSITIQASTTPSNDFATVKGLITGNTVTPTPSSAITMNQMTVRSGSLAVTVSSQPEARTVIAGAKGFEFARYIFDAVASGEDIRITTIPLYYDTHLADDTAGTRNSLTNCQLYDGQSVNSASLTTGSNVKNPASTDTASSTTFTFDGTGLIMPKGTSKTLSVRCDVSSSAAGTFWWGLDTGQASSYTGATGLTSAQTIAETLNEALGQKMTAAASGKYYVSNDSSVLYKVAQAGATGVTLAQLRFEASTTEAVVLKQVVLQLGTTASNSPSDLLNQRVTLWDGSTQIGEGSFNTTDFATSTLSVPITISKGDYKTVTVKGDLAFQDAVTGTPGAFIQINYDGNNNGLNGNYVTGVDSGVTVSGDTADVSTNGLRVFRSMPTVEDVTTTTALVAASNLYGIRITAGSGRDVGLRALSYTVSTSGPQLDNFQVFGPNGAVNATALGRATLSDTTATTPDGTTTPFYLRVNFDNTATDRIVQAGTSKTYYLRINNIDSLTSANTETVSVYLRGDSDYAHGIVSDTGLMGTLAQLEGSGNRLGASTTDNFLWTPFSSTTPVATGNADSSPTGGINAIADWMNSYGLPGFPGLGQNMPARSFRD